MTYIADDVFNALLDKQLEPHGVTYNEVKNRPNWFLEYTYTPQEADQWIRWGRKLLHEHLGSKKVAAEQMRIIYCRFGLKENPSRDLKQEESFAVFNEK